MFFQTSRPFFRVNFSTGVTTQKFFTGQNQILVVVSKTDSIRMVGQEDYLPFFVYTYGGVPLPLSFLFHFYLNLHVVVTGVTLAPETCKPKDSETST